jgi:hypothetical protein
VLHERFLAWLTKHALQQLRNANHFPCVWTVRTVYCLEQWVVRVVVFLLCNWLVMLRPKGAKPSSEAGSSSSSHRCAQTYMFCREPHLGSTQYFDVVRKHIPQGRTGCWSRACWIWPGGSFELRCVPLCIRSCMKISNIALLRVVHSECDQLAHGIEPLNKLTDRCFLSFAPHAWSPLHVRDIVIEDGNEGPSIQRRGTLNLSVAFCFCHASEHMQSNCPVA